MQLEQDPCLWELWLSPPHPTVSLSLNIFLALCAPLSFRVSGWMPPFQGLVSECLPRPQVWSPRHGEGKQVWVGQVPPDSVSADLAGAVGSSPGSLSLW